MTTNLTIQQTLQKISDCRTFVENIPYKTMPMSQCIESMLADMTYIQMDDESKAIVALILSKHVY